MSSFKFCCLQEGADREGKLFRDLSASNEKNLFLRNQVGKDIQCWEVGPGWCLPLLCVCPLLWLLFVSADHSVQLTCSANRRNSFVTVISC